MSFKIGLFNELMYFRISLVPSEGSPHLRIPYATVEYQILDKDHEKASIYFLIEYVVNMDGAIKSIEVSTLSFIFRNLT